MHCEHKDSHIRNSDFHSSLFFFFSGSTNFRFLNNEIAKTLILYLFPTAGGLEAINNYSIL